MSATTNDQGATLAPIESGTVYPLPNFQVRTGLKATALRSARRNGLKVRYLGGRGFVRGEDFLDFLSSHGKDTK